MRALVQRVSSARVRVGDEVVGQIGAGLCAFVGVTHPDGPEQASRLAAKLWHLRLFEGDRSVGETGGSLLVVSQFTLYGDTSRGRRPSWVAAAPSERAEPLVDAVVSELRALGGTVATGRFGATMTVELVNEGPVTLQLDV